MPKISLVNPFDPSGCKHLLTLNRLNKGVTKLALKLQANGLNELDSTVNLNIGSDAYNLLKTNFEVGLRLQDNDLDLMFIRDRQRQKDINNGQINAGFFGSMFRLRYTAPVFSGQKLVNQSAISILNSLDAKVSFVLLGSDSIIDIDAGSFNNLELIDKICKAAGGWTYFESGLVEISPGNYVTEVIVGDMQGLGALTAPRFQTETIGNNSKLAGINSPNLTLNDIEFN